MEGGSGISQSIIDDFDSSDIQRDQTKGKSGAS